MAKIKNASESWNGHTREEVEEFIKEQDKAAAEELATLKKNKADTAAVLFEKGAGSGSAVLKDGGNKAGGKLSLAAGNGCEASGDRSHAGGNTTICSGPNTFGHGYKLEISGNNAAAFGNSNKATASNAFAFGNSNEASGEQSMAGGYKTKSAGKCAVTLGTNTETNNQNELAEGRYNLSHKGEGAAGTLHSVGIGTSDSARKNAFEIMLNGDVYVLGIGGYDGTNAGASGVKTLQTIISEISMGGGEHNSPVPDPWDVDAEL